MGDSPEKFVYHGSDKKFDSDCAKPKRNIRSKLDAGGEQKIIFNEESFHATPHKWIALAYTYNTKSYTIDGKTAHYNMGVNLYEDNKMVDIFGFSSLEESLEKLYGGGGYVYHFDKDKFIYKEGLGNLEVIVTESTKPVSVERVDNPVEEMKKLGVTFKFTDLSLSENKEFRNYY